MSFRKQSMSDKFQIGLRTFCDDSTNDIHEYDTTVQTGVCDQKDIGAFKNKVMHLKNKDILSLSYCLQMTRIILMQIQALVVLSNKPLL